MARRGTARPRRPGRSTATAGAGSDHQPGPGGGRAPVRRDKDPIEMVDASTPRAGLDKVVKIDETTKLRRAGLDQLREVVRSRERDRHVIALGMMWINAAIVLGTGVAVGFSKRDAATLFKCSSHLCSRSSPRSSVSTSGRRPGTAPTDSRERPVARWRPCAADSRGEGSACHGTRRLRRVADRAAAPHLTCLVVRR